MTPEISNLTLITAILLIFFAYKKLPIFFHLFVLTIYFFASGFFASDFSQNFWKFYIFFAIIFSVPQVRRIALTQLIVKVIKKLGLLPKISETEKIALTSGTVWVDGQLFSGRPNFKWIFSQEYQTSDLVETYTGVHDP